MTKKFYTLPELPYDYKALGPHISEEQLKIHHQKHHQAYINGANGIFEKIDKARNENTEFDVRAEAKAISFQISGHILHSLFWENLLPTTNVASAKQPTEKINQLITENFYTFERFKKEFTQTAMSIEGSGWAVLILEKESGRLIIEQIEKHNVNIIPTAKILLALDMFEHAYYIDYKNDKAKYAEAFWNIVNWEKVEERLD